MHSRQVESVRRKTHGYAGITSHFARFSEVIYPVEVKVAKFVMPAKKFFLEVVEIGII